MGIHVSSYICKDLGHKPKDNSTREGPGFEPSTLLPVANNPPHGATVLWLFSEGNQPKAIQSLRVDQRPTLLSKV